MRASVDEARRAITRRQGLLLALAVVLVGGVLGTRVWQAARNDGVELRDHHLLKRIGGQTVGRNLDFSISDVPLEWLRGDGEVEKRPVLRPLLAEHKVVLLNFWASWCPPCLDELNSLYALSKAVPPPRLRVVAVSYDDDWSAQERVWSELLGTATPEGVLWLRDPQGQEGAKNRMMRSHFGTDKLPETYVLVGDTIVARFVGPQDWNRPAMRRYLESVGEARR